MINDLSNLALRERILTAFEERVVDCDDLTGLELGGQLIAVELTETTGRKLLESVAATATTCGRVAAVMGLHWL